MDLRHANLDTDDYRLIASLHCNYINKGFLSSLGIPFLSVLYEAIDNDDNSFLLVEKIENDIVGFVAGAPGLGKIYKNLLLKPFKLIFSLKFSILSPKIFFKILEIIVFSRNNKKVSDLPRNELLSIVVHPNYQGKGYSEILFKALNDKFKQKGVKSFKIIVGDSLSKAHAFYIKMGSVAFKKIEIHKGSSSTVYIKEVC